MTKKKEVVQQKEEVLYIKDIHERDSLHNKNYVFGFWDVDKNGIVDLRDYKLSPMIWDRNNDGVVTGKDAIISQKQPISLQYQGIRRAPVPPLNK